MLSRRSEWLVEQSDINYEGCKGFRLIGGRTINTVRY